MSDTQGMMTVPHLRNLMANELVIRGRQDDRQIPAKELTYGQVTEIRLYATYPLSSSPQMTGKVCYFFPPQANEDPGALEGVSIVPLYDPKKRTHLLDQEIRSWSDADHGWETTDAPVRLCRSRDSGDIGYGDWVPSSDEDYLRHFERLDMWLRLAYSAKSRGDMQVCAYFRRHDPENDFLRLVINRLGKFIDQQIGARARVLGY